MNALHLQEAMRFFVIGFLELSILFIAVSFLVEIINVFMTPERVQKSLSSKKSGYMIASFLGSVTPFCSCSTIPLTMGLLKSKAGFGPIMTFLFTSPLLNPIIVVVFYLSFGLKITLLYSVVALFASLGAGFLLEKFGFEKYVRREEETQQSCTPKRCETRTPTLRFSATKKDDCCAPLHINKERWHERVFTKSMMKKTWKQFLSFMPYIAIGIGIGALVHGFVPQGLIAKYAGSDNLFAVPFSALVGIPLYIRASAMVGFAPELIEQGVNMGSILALTIAGAGASLPELIMLKKIFKMPIIIFFLVAVFTMAIGCGYLVNAYISV